MSRDVLGLVLIPGRHCFGLEQRVRRIVRTIFIELVLILEQRRVGRGKSSALFHKRRIIEHLLLLAYFRSHFTHQ